MKTPTKIFFVFSTLSFLMHVSLHADNSTKDNNAKIEATAQELEIKAELNFTYTKYLILIGLVPVATGALFKHSQKNYSGFDELIPVVGATVSLGAGLGLTAVGGVFYSLGTLKEKEVKRLRSLISDAQKISQGSQVNLSVHNEMILANLLVCESCQSDEEKIVLTARLISDALEVGSELAAKPEQKSIEEFFESAAEQLGAESQEAELKLSQLIIFVDAGFNKNTNSEI